MSDDDEQLAFDYDGYYTTASTGSSIKINPSPGSITVKGTLSSTNITTGSGIHYNGNPYLHGTPYTNGSYTQFYNTGPSFPCSVCHTTIYTGNNNVDSLFLQGFWFCADQCRLEFVFRQLCRTDSLV